MLAMKPYLPLPLKQQVGSDPHTVTSLSFFYTIFLVQLGLVTWLLGFPHDQGCIWVIHRKTARLVFHGSWPNLSTRDRKPSNYQPGSGPRFPPPWTFPSPGGGLCFHWFHRNFSAVAWHWIGFLAPDFTITALLSPAVFRIHRIRKLFGFLGSLVRGTGSGSFPFLVKVLRGLKYCLQKFDF